MDEAITYKCPKDREGKSSLFKVRLRINAIRFRSKIGRAEILMKKQIYRSNVVIVFEKSEIESPDFCKFNRLAMDGESQISVGCFSRYVNLQSILDDDKKF